MGKIKFIESLQELQDQECKQETQYSADTQTKRHKQTKITDNKSAYYYVMNDQQQQKAIQLLMNFIIKSSKPLCIVEDPSFKSFIQFINPSFKIPSRKQVTLKHLPVFYQDVKQ